MTFPELWSHQKKLIELNPDRFGVWFDPGLGKSRATLDIAGNKLGWNSLIPSMPLTIHNSGLAMRPMKTIILAPLNVCRNWLNEIRLNVPAPFFTYLVAGETKAKKLKTLNAFIEHRHNPQFLVCNTESLRSKEYLELLKRSRAQCIIADEAHNFKTATSLQTKGLISLVDYLRVPYLYLLTGTPSPQGYIDLWSTFYLLQKTRDSFFVWRKKNFMDKNARRRGMNNYWPEYIVTERAKVLFDKWLSECTMTAKKDECLDLPPLLRTTIYAEMSPSQSKQYATMKEYLFAIDSDGQELNASNMLVRTLRLQQILAGCTERLANPRLEALRSAIEKTNGEQFIVWTIFADTYQDVAKEVDYLGMTYGLLTGKQSAEERHKNIEDFQAGKIRCLIANPKAGGVGVNLTAASYSIHYTRSFSLVDDLQCEARNYRGGSERHKRITRIDIVTPDTIDEEITSALRDKKSVQDFIMGLKSNKERIAV